MGNRFLKVLEIIKKVKGNIFTYMAFCSSIGYRIALQLFQKGLAVRFFDEWMLFTYYII